MSCDICGRGSCASWMHPATEQEQFADVIEAFERARELRNKVKDGLVAAPEQTRLPGVA